ncbi:MAG: bifunctional (p)ppGpp synthetase/guanosine-3,5-bis(diphosphate) 3-pyrophosphohydrolase [Agromyces sp.]|nr:bifunctional (p)ppGpp synthetase/guanosine-3,5-bis(diphosphate) 3-pyrophosphohydrolase [Agromyces sp.]
MHHPKADLALVERAYTVAERAHEGQKRKSGEPYITHPVAVAQILADLGIGSKTVAAALLHDTVEDTAYTLDQVRADFGDEIAMLVDGVTKLDKVKYGDSTQAETVRKMIVAMSKDIRVLIIKLADRLHNARTWGFVPAESATRKATETLEIYAPLAHRLGIQAIKLELEDLSFAVLYPKLYAEIESLVKQRTPQREEFVQNVIDLVSDDLKAAKIRGKVMGRPKQYYSIYQKMIVRGRDFDEIYDLTGIRVLVNSVRDCYAVLGAIHARWTPLPGRFKDYIATPKFNLYQSLHTTVIGPKGRPVEIQIRTHDMHQRAEYGVAAHWKYKERMNSGRTTEVAGANETDMAWLAHISDWQAETADPGEFLDSLRFEIGAKEVYVFTPKGRVIGLPAGATPVDFAYAVHTEVGHRTMGAKVNGRLVPLESELNSGDVVEVFTSKNPDSGPSQDWLTFVKSPRARNKIRQWFTKERRDEAIEQGRDAIARAMRKQNLPLQKLMSQESFAEGAGAVAPDAAQLGFGRARARRTRHPGETCSLLHPGARRRDRGLHHPRIGRLGAPGQLPQRAGPDAGTRAHDRRRVGSELQEPVPRADPDRGARQGRPPLRCDPGALGAPREHPLGQRVDLHRPPRAEQVRLRDGRHDAPRPGAERRAAHRRGVRRLPGERRLTRGPGGAMVGGEGALEAGEGERLVRHPRRGVEPVSER